MTRINNISIEFFNIKAELLLDNSIYNIDTINKITTIVSGSKENIFPIYKINNISLIKEKLETQAVK